MPLLVGDLNAVYVGPLQSLRAGAEVVTDHRIPDGIEVEPVNPHIQELVSPDLCAVDTDQRSSIAKSVDQGHDINHVKLNSFD